VIFKKITSTKPVVDHLYEEIKKQLDAKKKVLWLIPGGSSIPIAAAVSKKLADIDTGRLTVGLTDERYGPVGHKNSNWRQLEEAGFSLPDAKLFPMLVDRPLEDTVKSYEKNLVNWLKEADYRLAFDGLGADKHTFGIKPKSPAVFSNQLVSGYRGEDFVRLTLTPKAIAMMDEIVIYAVGEDKHQALNSLDSDGPLVTEPSQALKQVHKLTIYNDYKGEAV
jgi:6-phosphogluconolactonase/glucosamine-6-phosphate isomerase/deaminase